MNDNIFKDNDRKKAEHDDRYKVFCEVYDPNVKHTKKEWLDILKKKGVNISRMTFFRYTKMLFERVTHEEDVTHERKDVLLEEIVESTKKNPIIRDILLQERTSGTRFGINPDKVVPRHMKSATIRKERTKTKAEVFTPIEIVKKMNDYFEMEFTGSDIDYIKRRVLEVTCGEAPYLTT